MKTQVLVIGGGATGTGIARDLALRGIKCILAEKKDINAGASGANHGLLHSGARYVGSDPEAASECREEGEILKRLAPHCIENTGGLFVAVQGDDEAYIAKFPNNCKACGIPSKEIDIKEAKALEPKLSPKLIAAYMVEDASVDPFKLSLENMAHAQQLGSVLLRNSKVIGFKRSKTRISAAILRNMLTNEEFDVEAEHIINASGAWAGEVAKMIGAKINVVYSKGSLIITQNRLNHRVINRLRLASDGDILVPGGTVSIIGTTSVRTETLDDIYPTVKEVDQVIDAGAQMVPELETTRYIRAYCGVRPLISMQATGSDRRVSRGFVILDHSDIGIENFTTISGGKLTTYRLMAEKTVDSVCKRMGITAQCKTRTEPLPDTIHARWTEPGRAPKVWIRKQDPNDYLLCECDMVHKNAVDSIIESMHEQKTIPDLTGIGLRSRVGKGPCQGAFCSLRIASHMYDTGEFSNQDGLNNLKNFINERWRGQQSLLWDMPLAQMELMEALHCGALNIEAKTK